MVKFLMRGHMEEIDTSLARSLDENDRARSQPARVARARRGRTKEMAAAKSRVGRRSQEYVNFCPAFMSTSIADSRNCVTSMWKGCGGVLVIAVPYSLQWEALC